MLRARDHGKPAALREAARGLMDAVGRASSHLGALLVIMVIIVM